MSCKPLQSEHLHITFGVFLLTFNVVDEDSCKSMVIWICGWCLLWSCHLRGTLSFAMFIVHLKRIEGRFDVNDSVPYNTIALCLKGMVSLRYDKFAWLESMVIFISFLFYNYLLIFEFFFALFYLER